MAHRSGCSVNIVFANERRGESRKKFGEVWVHGSLKESGLCRREENALMEEAESSIGGVDGI